MIRFSDLDIKLIYNENENNLRLYCLCDFSVGKNISTKAIGWRLSSSPHFSDREDLTMQYKHPEGSTLERAAVWRASSMSTKPNMYSENENNDDVTIKIADVEDITFGNDFQLPVTLKNNSYAERTVNMMVSLYSIFYTGIICRKLKKLSFQCVIPANSGNIQLVFKLSVLFY